MCWVRRRQFVDEEISPAWNCPHHGTTPLSYIQTTSSISLWLYGLFHLLPRGLRRCKMSVCLSGRLSVCHDSWTFRYFASSPPRTFRYHLRWFATWTVRHLDVLSPVSKFLRTSLTSGGETSRETAKRPGIETSQGAKHRGGEASRWRTGKVAKRHAGVLSKWINISLNLFTIW